MLLSGTCIFTFKNKDKPLGLYLEVKNGLFKNEFFSQGKYISVIPF